MAVGSPHCQGTGYRDRIGIFELAVATSEIVAGLERCQGERELRQLLRHHRIPCLLSDGLQKVREGITTLEEVQSMACLLAEPPTGETGLG